MAKLTHTPHNYSQALLALDNKTSKKIGNNTWLEFKIGYTTEFGIVPNRVVVRLHATDIVTFDESGSLILNSGGYQTVTTKERMNQILPSHLKVLQRDFQWFVWNIQTGRSVAFFDGIDPQAATKELQFF